jgi:hypothetical protein
MDRHQVDCRYERRAMYTLLIIGAVVILVAGIPAIELLMNWIRPLTPEQEERRRLLREARRSYDRFRRY